MSKKPRKDYMKIMKKTKTNTIQRNTHLILMQKRMQNEKPTTRTTTTTKQQT